MKSMTDATTATLATTTSFSVWYSYINQGLAFFLLILSIVLTLARLWSWWEERKGKHILPNLPELDTDTGSSEMDDLFYLE